MADLKTKQTTNKAENIKCQQDVEKVCTMGKNIKCAATMKNSMEVSQTIQHRIPYDPAVPFLGIYPKELFIAVDKI